MVTTELAARLLAFAAGGAVAALYFASLWWTVRRVARARRPLALVAGSFLVRAALAALAIVAVGSGDALRLMAAMAGFLAVRLALVKWVRGTAHVPSTAGAHQENR